VAKKKKKERRTYSDSTLSSLWRKAVWVLNGMRCPFCGNTNFEQVQIHHIIHRASLLLRFDFRNGIPACNCEPQGDPRKYEGKTCHQFADSNAGRDFVREIKGETDWKYLIETELKTSSAEFTKQGITRDEFMMEKHRELTTIIEHARKFTYIIF
jgi:hypothetical protein